MMAVVVFVEVVVAFVVMVVVVVIVLFQQHELIVARFVLLNPRLQRLDALTERFILAREFVVRLRVCKG